MKNVFFIFFMEKYTVSSKNISNFNFFIDKYFYLEVSFNFLIIQKLLSITYGTLSVPIPSTTFISDIKNKVGRTFDL